MTFEQFQATGIDAVDISDFTQDEMHLGIGGRIYLGALDIEDTGTWPANPERRPTGRWYTMIDRSEFDSDDLTEIERVLYGWAVDNGYTL